MGAQKSSPFVEVMKNGVDDMEDLLTSSALTPEMLFTPEVVKAIEGVIYIAQHLKDEDDNANVREAKIRLKGNFCWVILFNLFTPLVTIVPHRDVNSLSFTIK